MRSIALMCLLAAWACGGDDDDVPLEGRLGGECSDGADNDGDGDIDCADDDCASEPECRDAGVDAADASDAEDGSLDDAAVDVDAADAGSCEFAPPYGTRVGRTMAPIVPNERDPGLTACDGSSATFPNADSCAARFTLLLVVAGWCRPCVIDAARLEEVIRSRYTSADVHVTSLLTQDSDFNVPSSEYCSEWVDRNGLSSSVLIDAHARSNVYFPDNALPVYLIVGRDGAILDRIQGPRDLDDVQARLDELVAG